MEQSYSENTTVTVVKGNNPEDTVLDGIDKLGGISKYINKDDQVFIKFNLTLPNGFPTNTNLNTLKAIIQSCNNAGAKKIFLGAFPFDGFTIKAVSDSLGLKDYFENLGAEFLFLDNSNFFGFGSKKLKAFKKMAFTKVEVNNENFLIPKIILNSDKLISVNQINVDPQFHIRLSLYNSFSMIPNNSQKIDINLGKGDEKYKHSLVSKIIDVFTIKKPSLIINDLFYILEGAGPLIYKDSRLNKTGIVITGTDAVAVDCITLRLLKLDLNHDLLLEAKKRNLGISELPKIKIIGENLESINIDLKQCVYNLKDINLRNFSICEGQICSGCFERAYHLLNLMKTNMVKDMKYISQNNSFIIGENPTEAENLDNRIIIFGDCAINSTKDSTFRKKVKEYKKKSKIKINERVLEIPGCPPNIFDSIELLLAFYKKKNLPTLNLLSEINKFYLPQKIRKQLKLWEAL